MCERSVGTCRVTGIEACDENTGLAVCFVEENPDAEERCDSRDNDCDGEIDETFHGDEPYLWRRRVWSIRSLGVRYRWAECHLRCHSGRAEELTGLNDDCDETADEDFAGLGEPCAIQSRRLQS